VLKHFLRGRPRFSQTFLHGEPVGSPTPSYCKWCEHHRRSINKILFLSFLVNSAFLAPFAVLLKLNLLSDKLLILARPIVGALAGRALQFDELVLGHEATI
jgi:hypothetical protein